MRFIPNYSQINLWSIIKLYLHIVFTQFFYDKIKKKYLETSTDNYYCNVGVLFVTMHY